jgi:hypothetical protein
VACGAMRAQASVRVADALIAELAKVQS